MNARTPVRSAPFGFGSLLGSSPSFEAVKGRARELAREAEVPVLVVGEPGTGKELLARAMHFDSERALHPFVTLDCRTLDAGLLEAELFGTEDGAVPGMLGGRQGLLETAGAGTLFLRRLDELPVSIQPGLLLLLQSGTARRIGGGDALPVHCRIVTSASQRLSESVTEGRFRKDLLEPFEATTLTLPPLRRRDEDVALLADHFQQRVASVEGLPSRAFSPEAVAALLERRWPGNVRELKRVVEEAVVGAAGPRIELTDLPFGPPRKHGASVLPDGTTTIVIPPEGKSLEEVEAETVAAVLRITGGNKSAASRILGISRPTLTRKARKYGLQDA